MPLTVAAQQAGMQWRAGVARVVITPSTPMWMAGYGFRDHPSEGILHDLYAKALALEDARGNRAVLVTTDLLGFPKGLSDRIRDRLNKQFELSRAQVLLNSSHTHTGPVLTDALMDIYPLSETDQEKVEQYTKTLEEQIVALVGNALRGLQPAHVFAENGVARFQVNRRNNDAATLASQTNLNGPNDYAVPVIKVAKPSGELMAIAFGYACHNTVLNLYKWSGDYAGFAQLELEKMYPGVTTLFFQGAGADQNPLPRGTVGHAIQYGRTLAAAVDRVVQADMRPLSATLRTAYEEIELTLAPPPSSVEFAKLAQESSGYQKRWARRLHQKMERGEPLPGTYPYPLQLWKVGDQIILGLGGELVVEYAIALKRIFGPETFVLGYSNDVMAYIPSARILGEGGYEGHSSQMVYGLPSKWTSDVEAVILHGMVKLARQTGIPEQNKPKE